MNQFYDQFEDISSYTENNINNQQNFSDYDEGNTRSLDLFGIKSLIDIYDKSLKRLIEQNNSLENKKFFLENMLSIIDKLLEFQNISNQKRNPNKLNQSHPQSSSRGGIMNHRKKDLAESSFPEQRNNSNYNQNEFLNNNFRDSVRYNPNPTYNPVPTYNTTYNPTCNPTCNPTYNSTCNPTYNPTYNPTRTYNPNPGDISFSNNFHIQSRTSSNAPRRSLHYDPNDILDRTPNSKKIINPDPNTYSPVDNDVKSQSDSNLDSKLDRLNSLKKKVVISPQTSSFSSDDKKSPDDKLKKVVISSQTSSFSSDDTKSLEDKLKKLNKLKQKFSSDY